MFTLWLSSAAGKRVARRNYFKPHVESLEDRAVPAQTTPFTFLQTGFTQHLYAVGAFDGIHSQPFLYDVAFAPNGDPWVENQGVLLRYDSHTTTAVHGSPIHPLLATATIPAGSVIANHPNGALYENTVDGVVKLDANTGAVLGGPFGPAGNGNGGGIVTDPKTGNLIYVGDLIDDHFVNPTFSQGGVFASAGFSPDLVFDPTGNFLFLCGGALVSVYKRDGTFVQAVNIGHNSRGMAFHAVGNQFLVTDNSDGTMPRIDFPGNDFTRTPTVSLFASGGSLGESMKVAPDGNLYVTQSNAVYADGTITNENSIVVIGPGFAPSSPPSIAAAAIHLAQSVVFFNQVKPRSPRTAISTITLTNNTGADVTGDYTVTFAISSVKFIGFATNGKVAASGVTKDGKYFLTFKGGLKKGQSVCVALQFTYLSIDSLDAIRHRTLISAISGD